MYLIRKTKSFEKSYKKIQKSGVGSSAIKDLGIVVDLLSQGKILPISHRDHWLNGKLKNFRECHIRGDILLIYKIEKEKLVLVLVDIGAHSKLFN